MQGQGAWTGYSAGSPQQSLPTGQLVFGVYEASSMNASYQSWHGIYLYIGMMKDACM